MKKALLASFVLLAASAVGQVNKVYVMKDIKSGYTDVTTMTATLSAWKLLPSGGVCAPKTLAIGAIDASPWCRGTDGYTYLFDHASRSWQRQGMGTAALYFIVKDVNNVYSLQSVAHCAIHGGVQYYGFFRWIGSWQEQNSSACISQASIGTDDVVDGIGWDLAHNVSALFQSMNEGSSWTLISDGFIFTTLNDKAMGCAIDTTHGIWVGVVGSALSSLSVLPSGTVAGCAYASYPTTVMAWNTAGAVYTMPLENYGTWQAVSGITASMIAGNRRFWLFGEDTTGKPWHWNVNAPTASATFGGQWNPSLGCPNSNSPCGTGAPGFPIPTHTVSGRVYFTSGHGIDGKKRISTQTYTNDIEVLLQDTNPLCDPFLGQQGDPECVATAEGDGECNQSMQPVGSDSWQVLGVGESIDDSSWINNDAAQSSQAPYILAGVAGIEGIWAADSWNYITNACPLTSPVSPGTCPLQSPEHSGFTQAFEGQGASDVVYGSVLTRLSAGNEGIDSPYVYYDAYMIIQLPDGSTFNQCLGTPNDDNLPYKFLWTAWVLLPECK